LGFGAWQGFKYIKNSDLSFNLNSSAIQCIDHTKAVIETGLTLDTMKVLEKSKIAFDSCLNINLLNKEV
jgi:hypothetical protein